MIRTGWMTAELSHALKLSAGANFSSSLRAETWIHETDLGAGGGVGTDVFCLSVLSCGPRSGMEQGCVPELCVKKVVCDPRLLPFREDLLRNMFATLERQCFFNKIMKAVLHEFGIIQCIETKKE